MSDGSVVAVGPGVKPQTWTPGSERVLFALGNGFAFYCGLITHIAPMPGFVAPGIVPSKDCTPTP